MKEISGPPSPINRAVLIRDGLNQQSARELIERKSDIQENRIVNRIDHLKNDRQV
jgi:hypothetical protein